MPVFWVVMSCALVERYKRFGEAYCHHLQGYIAATTSYVSRVFNVVITAAEN
jgi:hypothetical protein